MPVYERFYDEKLERIATALESIAGTLLEIKEQHGPHFQGVPLPEIPGFTNLESALGDGSPSASAADEEASSKPVDAAALAREAEELLNAAATPRVKAEVEVGEGEKPAPALHKINLFKQPRLDINDLVDRCQDDPIIKEYLRKRDLPEQSVHATLILGAAISLVYKHLPTDLWGSEEAAKAVVQFVAQHSEEQ